MQTETQDKMRNEVNAVEKEKQVVTQRSEQKVQLQNKKEESNMENLKIKYYWYNTFRLFLDSKLVILN